MRFCDLFTEYKIEIKKFDKASKGVSWKKLPWQNKLLTILIVIITIVWTIFYVRNMQQMANWTLAILLIVIAIGLQIEETTSMLKFRLKKISRKYSKKRMKKVINLLKKHQINIHNIEGMKLLIEEAEKQKRKGDCFQDFKKILKNIGVVITTIGLFGQKEVLYEKFWGELAIATKIHLVGIIMLLVVLGYVLAPLIIQIISPDYYMYDKFIEDLRQVVLFYSSIQENI